MIVILGAALGFIAGRMLWLALRRTWQQDSLLRKNYQGHLVPTAAGVIVLLALVTVEGFRALLSGGSEPFTAPRLAVLVAVAGFALLGFIDDLLGARGPKGFGGHMRSLASGQLTSGGVKMIGGGFVALVACSIVGVEGIGDLLLSAAVVALAANLFNLLDLRPGRTTKVGLVVFAVLAVVSLLNAAFLPVAVVMGAAAALLRDELHERLMLGDAGANAIGAALGMAMVIEFGFTGTAIAFGVLLALNLLSEFVSFTKIIEATPPLAALDRLGRPEAKTVDLRDEPIRMPAEPFAQERSKALAGPGKVVDAPVAAGAHFARDRSPFPAGSTVDDDEEFSDDLFGFDNRHRQSNGGESPGRNPVEDDRPEWPF